MILIYKPDSYALKLYRMNEKWISDVKAFESYCVVTSGYVNKDGGHSIRSVIAKNAMLHANFTALCVIQPELLPIESLHCGNRNFRHFCSFDPDPWTRWLSRLSLPRCDCIYWKTVTTITYRVGGSKETWHYWYKTVNIYTSMKIQLTFIIKQPQLYTTRTTLSTQKNKRNFSTIASRVRASPSRSHCRCKIPDEKEGKSADCTIFRCPRPPADSCCRHNSSITSTAVAAATPMSKMKRSRHHW